MLGRNGVLTVFQAKGATQGRGLLAPSYKGGVDAARYSTGRFNQCIKSCGGSDETVLGQAERSCSSCLDHLDYGRGCRVIFHRVMFPRVIRDL